MNSHSKFLYGFTIKNVLSDNCQDHLINGIHIVIS